MDWKDKNLRLVGERIYLRPMRISDATEEYYSWLNDPEVNRFLETKSATIEGLHKYITKKSGQSDVLFCGIFLNDGDRHIGTITLREIDLATGKATIAMMIGNKNYWGKGLISEAMRLLIDYSFQKLELKEINLGVLAQNIPAIRAYEKMGFVEIERSKNVRRGDKSYDQVIMVFKREL